MRTQPDGFFDPLIMLFLVIGIAAPTLAQRRGQFPFPDGQPDRGGLMDKMKALRMTYEYDEIPGAGHPDTILLGARYIFDFFNEHVRR